jgi:hypothetical protein
MNLLGLSQMTRLLKVVLLTILFLGFLLVNAPGGFTASQNSFVKALQSPEWNLESMVAGKNLISGQEGYGMISATSEALIGYMVGYQDQETGEWISDNSAVHGLAYFTGSLYNKPASSTEYLAYIRQNLGIPSAYAQTPGARFLSPVISLWEIVRNISYVFFIIIFVIFGFMIMFRSKLDPQTTINVQLALPKIIVSLLLVTFSFAILSFIVDLTYFANNLVTATFKNELNSISSQHGGSFTWSTYDSGSDGGFLNYILSFFGGEDPALGPASVIVSTIVDALGNIGGLVGGNFSTVFNLIIAFTLLSTLIKIFMGLLTKHVTIILSTIGAPIVFAFGSLSPQAGFAQFLKSFIAACLTFPATFLILNFAMFFASVKIPDLNQTIAPFFAPTGEDQFAGTLGELIGLGMLIVASKVPEAIDQALGTKPGALAAAGAEIGGSVRKIPVIGGLMGG